MLCRQNFDTGSYQCEVVETADGLLRIREIWRPDCWRDDTLRSSVASRSLSLSVSASDLLVCAGCGSGTAGCWDTDTGRGKGSLCLGSPAMEAKQESETVLARVRMEQGSPYDSSQ
jgi:hypothetical protein